MSQIPRLRDSGNDLLDRLPADEFDSLEPMLQRVSLTTRQVVHQLDADISHVHFPTTALLSLLTVLEEDDPVETATVGREGFIGLAAAMGVEASPHRVICQMNGDSLRLPVRPFLEAMERNRGLTGLIHRYVAYSLYTASQAVACNALHNAEARASRWLLTTHDQAHRDEFPMTQEFLAFMLGVRRQTVTVIAGALQSAGLIGYQRGVMRIVDRPRLEDAACECYAALRGYYERVVSRQR
jgi:CRP-like cAMP-binding protein